MATRASVPGSGGTDDTSGQPLHASGIDKFPGGLVAYTSVSAQATITTITDIASLTFTFYANRMYRIVGRIRAQSSVANDVIRCSITDSSNTALDVVEQAVPVANVDGWWYLQARVSPSAGSATYKLRGLRTGGSGTILANGGSSGTSATLLEIFDDGPSF